MRDAAIISDLHLGSGVCQAKTLLSFLKEVPSTHRRLVLNGDVFDDAKPTPTEQAAFRAGLDTLLEANIPVVMITGDHDTPRQVGRTHALAIFDEYANVTVMDRPGVVFGGDVLLPVACMPVVRRAHIAAHDPEFEKLGLDEQNNKIVILLTALLATRGTLKVIADEITLPIEYSMMATRAIEGADEAVYSMVRQRE